MTSQNLVSATLSAETKAEILQKLGEIKGKLDFLLSLQTKEIRSLFKAGNVYLPFIDKAYQTAIQHPEILPGVFDMEEFKKDYELSRDLSIIITEMEQLTKGIENTLMAVTSDSMAASLEVYAAVKQHHNKVPGLQVVAEEMAEFFKKSKKKNEKAAV